MRRLIVILTVIVAMLGAGNLLAAKKGVEKKLSTKLCDLGDIRLDDGDSFSCAGEQIRVLGIDTPETRHPDHGLMKDQPMGKEATKFTYNALKKAKRILIIRGGTDPYKRTLAHVLLDGNLLGVMLIKAGLAFENISRYGDNGMPEFALEISEAWKSSPRPSFQDPHLWRKYNRGKLD
jgi:endonuclease YncB( thermonuclease family)